MRDGAALPAPRRPLPTGLPGLARELRLLRHAILYELQKATAFRVGFFVREVLVGLDRPAVMIFLFHALLRSTGGDTIGGYAFPDLVDYLILVAIFQKLLVTEWVLDLSDHIFEGYITKFFVMPFRYFTLVLGRFLQYTGVQALVAILLAVAGALVAPEWWPRPAGTAAVAQAAVLVLLGSYAYLLVLFILHAMAFWLDVIWTLVVMSRFIMIFLSGAILPLGIMPDAAQRALAWLFPYWTLYAPIEIALGRMGAADFARGAATLLVWVVVLQLLAGFTWRRGVKSYTGAGM